jgi:predicted histone-like DNA-binding protein
MSYNFFGMPIKYNVVQRGNPHKRNEPKKLYAQVNSDGEVGFKELGEAITQLYSVHYFEVLTVPCGKTPATDLGENKIVRFGDFGSFRVGAGSKGVEKAEKSRSAMIDSTKVIFTPGKDLKTMLNNLKV